MTNREIFKVWNFNNKFQKMDIEASPEIEKFSNTYQALNEVIENKEDILNKHIQFLKEEIDIRIESIVQELNEIRETFYRQLDGLAQNCEVYLNTLETKKKSEDKIYQDILRQKTDETKLDFYNKKLQQYLTDFNDWFSKVTFDVSEASFSNTLIGKIESDLIIGENTKHRAYKSIQLTDARQGTSMCSIGDIFVLLVDKRDNKIIRYNQDFKVSEQISSIAGMKLNRPSLICSDEIEHVFICNSNGTEIIITDLNIKKIKCVLDNRNDSYSEYFQFIKDIKFYNGLLYVLDMEASAIQFYRSPFEKLQRKIFLKNDKNEHLSNPTTMSVMKNTIAILDDSRKVLVYNLLGELVSKIFNENIGFIKSLCFASNYLFLHAGEGLFICYKIKQEEDDFGDQIPNKIAFDKLFEREISSLRETSEAMIYFNKKITILLPYAKTFIVF